MSRLAPLLEIQELDLAADAKRAHSESLPERALIPSLANKRLSIEAEIAVARAEKEAAQAEEESLGVEVSKVAHAIEQAELDRYSGKRIDRDEAAAHDDSQRALREKKSNLEEREMELLEAVESIDARLATHQQAHEESLAETEKAEAVIRGVETELEAELERLGGEREKVLPTLPETVVVAYERVRGQPRAAGRGAASLAAGRCGGCRIKLPSLEVTKMLAEPEDAVIQCPQCRRVLVR